MSNQAKPDSAIGSKSNLLASIDPIEQMRTVVLAARESDSMISRQWVSGWADAWESERAAKQPDRAAPGGDVERRYEFTLQDGETILPVAEALPCPFCGQQPTIQPWHGGGPRKRLIRCPAEYYDQCAVAPSVAGSTRSQALGRWNRRSGHER